MPDTQAQVANLQHEAGSQQLNTQCTDRTNEPLTAGPPQPDVPNSDAQLSADEGIAQEACESPQSGACTDANMHQLAPTCTLDALAWALLRMASTCLPAKLFSDWCTLHMMCRACKRPTS